MKPIQTPIWPEYEILRVWPDDGAAIRLVSNKRLKGGIFRLVNVVFEYNPSKVSHEMARKLLIEKATNLLTKTNTHV